MPKYLFTGEVHGQAAKDIHPRVNEAGPGHQGGVRLRRGTLESYHFAFGSDDYFIIGDLPDDASAAALALSTSASGAVHTRTVVLLTPEEVDGVARLSPDYRAPGS